MLFLLRIIEKISRHPLLLISSILIAVCLSSVGASKLSGQVDFNDYFAKDDPKFLASKQLGELYRQQDQLWLLLESSKPWTSDELNAAVVMFKQQLLTEVDVTGVYGYTQLLDDSVQFQLQYKTHPRRTSLISSDSKAILLSIELQQPTHANTQPRWLEQRLTQLYKETQEYWQPWQVSSYFTGTQALNWQYAKSLKHDLIWFAPGVLLLFGLMSLLFIRHWQWVAAIVVNSLITLILTVGLAGWLQLTLAAICAFIPVIVMTLSFAYTAHLYFAWQHNLSININVFESLRLSVSSNIAPLTYASLTTSIGFLLLMMSPSPPISSFGLLVAFAVMVNYGLAMSLLLLMVRKAKGQQRTILNFKAVLNWAKCASKYPKGLLSIIIVVSVVCSYSVSQLTINDNPVGYFSNSSAFSQSEQKMTQYFNGINTFKYNVSQTNSEGLNTSINGNTLSFLYAFSRFLRQQPQVNSVQHIGDWVKSAGLTQSQFDHYIKQENTSTILANELSNSRQQTLISLFLVPMSSKQLIEFEKTVAEWLEANLSNDSPNHSFSNIRISDAVSPSLLFAHLSANNARSMLWSFITALILLTFLIAGVKRSWQCGAIALLLNFLPLLWVFGIWQWFGGYISLGGTIVLCMMLGIIVDDTLHLLLKLPDRNQSLSSTELVAEMWLKLERVVPVISFTSLTIFIGFSLGLLSGFMPILQLSLLSGLVMIFAWLCDVFLLPVLYATWLNLALPHSTKLNSTKLNSTLERSDR
ncbi:efflux RND transporter permease subunit [Shewanella donghaensis]|uniref:efflux RND transporter permease subunit n=1 Tax=Shewanella donghaensis TaxID=238836 RepID=UPI0011845633|nr:RND transporter [Shewanella donghaensis]